MTTFPTQLEMKKKFRKVFTAEQTTSLVETIDVVQQAEIERAADIKDLKQGQAKLTVNQDKLIVGQAKLTTNQNKLIAGQAKLITNQDKLTANQNKLIVGQAKLITEVATLTVAQKQTNKRIDNLTYEVRSGFKELRQEIDGINQSIDRLHKAVGSLGNTLGFKLEEFVSYILPPYLESQANVTDVVLERQFFEAKDGGLPLEVDLVGNGQRDGQAVLILTECRTTIGGGEMRRIAKKLDDIAADITDIEIIKIVVVMNLHPTGRDTAKETGIWAIPYIHISRAYYA